MNTRNGWSGVILFVDLTNRKITKESLSKEFAKKYVGGSGFGARLLYDLVPPGDNALSPENVIIIAHGPLCGIPLSAGRFELIGKSPLTGIFHRTSGGGFFTPELKFAGYDLVVIQGQADKPVYLWIDDDDVEIRDAAHLWGKDTWMTQKIIREELGDPEVQTLKIGPAGENMCYTSCVIGGLSRAAGTGSAGAVWGSKKLKAVAVRGSKEMAVARPRELLDLCKTLQARFVTDANYFRISRRGTPGGASDPEIESSYKGTPFYKLHTDHLLPLWQKSLACFGCSLHCGHYYNVKTGKYKGTTGEGPEGATPRRVLLLRVADPQFLLKYNNVCNQLGLHVGTPGVGLAWAMELYENGIITKKDTDGLEMTWGNQDTILAFLNKIAHKEGFGEIVDGYPIRAAQKLGRGSDLYIYHIKGGANQFIRGEEIVVGLEYALGHGVATRGYDHLSGATGAGVDAPYSYRYKVDHDKKSVSVKTGDGENEALDRYKPNPGIAEDLYTAQIIASLYDMTALCKQMRHLRKECPKMDEIAQLMTLATGVDFSVDDLIKAAERENLLARAFNAREGMRRMDDYPYPFYYLLKHGKEHPLYDYKGFPFSIDDYGKVLSEFYERSGCDLETGIPTRKKLESVDLKDIADDLEKLSILPE